MSEEFWHDSSRIPIEITIAKADSGITNENPSLLFSFEILMYKLVGDISKYLFRIIGSLNYKPCEKKYRGSAFLSYMPLCWLL